MNKQITVEIDTEGEVTVDAQGYTGESCREATGFLEKALGRSVTQRLKPDYWISHSVGRTNRNIGLKQKKGE